MVDDKERQSILQLLQRDHPSHDIHQLYSHYHSRTHSPPTPDPGLVLSIRISTPKRNRILVDKSHYLRVPSHLYSSMWADIYRPLTCNEVLGNSKQCALLYNWLADWTGRRPTKTAVKCETVRCTSKKGVAWVDDDFLSHAEVKGHRHRVLRVQRKMCYSSESEEDEGSSLSAMLLCGPPGCGKTASVYACAHQLGVKVSALWY